MPDPLKFRQSRLRAYVQCPRRTVLDTEWSGGFVGASADLGSAFHEIAAEILRTLRRQDEEQMATEEAVAIMREVMATGPWVISAADYKWLTQFVCTFADFKWRPSRFLAIEDRLSMEIPCPDGEIRTLTGTPDLVVADPPRGAVIVDHKTGMGIPRTPRELPEEGEPIRGAEYQSDGADMQLAVYGLLVMRQWPRVQSVILREQNVRWGGPPRESQITRDDVEHIVPYLGDLMMKVDRGLAEGDGSDHAKPRAGAHCITRCAVSRSCPIARESRGLGALETPQDAADEAACWVAGRALDAQRRKALIAHHEQTGEPIMLNGFELAWHVGEKGRRFNFHENGREKKVLA